MDTSPVLGTALLAASIYPRAAVQSPFGIVLHVSYGPEVDPQQPGVLEYEGVRYLIIQRPPPLPQGQFYDSITEHYLTTTPSSYHPLGFTVSITKYKASQYNFDNGLANPAQLATVLNIPAPVNAAGVPAADGNQLAPASLDFRPVLAPFVAYSTELICHVMRTMFLDPVTAQTLVDKEVKKSLELGRAPIAVGVGVDFIAPYAMRTGLRIIQRVLALDANNNLRGPENDLDGYKAGILLLCGYVPSTFEVTEVAHIDPDNAPNQVPSLPDHIPTTILCSSSARSHILRNPWKCHQVYTTP